MDYSPYQNGLLFAEAYTVVRQRIQAILSQYELSTSDWSILVITNQAADGIRLANVAKQMNVKAPLITMLTNKLIDRSYIQRIPHHSDRRAKLLVITAEGKKLLSRLSRQLDGEVGLLLAGVSPESMTNFQNALETIIQNAKQ